MKKEGEKEEDLVVSDLCGRKGGREREEKKERNAEGGKGREKAHSDISSGRAE